MLRATTVLLLALSLSLHWALLQTVAWTGMVVRYSQRSPLKEAIAKTFDGKHPCPLCLTIQKGRAEEQKKGQPQQTTSILKMDPALLWQSQVLVFAPLHSLTEWPNWPAHTRLECPPTPPPRRASA